MAHLLDFAVITIFAREFLEGTIILGEYRTIIQRGGTRILEPGVTVEKAHRAVWTSAWVAIAAALLVIAAIAIPLSVLSRNFDDGTSKIIEGLSKMVAGVCLLQLSLKLPKFLGVYGSTKKNKKKTTTKTNKDKAKDAGALAHKDTASVATDNETRTATTGSNGAAIQLGAAAGYAKEQTNETNQDADARNDEDNNNEEEEEREDRAAEPTAHAQLSLKNMRFNVAWNIWREGKKRKTSVI